MNCRLCQQMFELQNPDKHPRLLVQCGHTFCTKCIQTNIDSDNNIVCHQCGKIQALQGQSFPLNETLMSILNQKQQGLCNFIKQLEICKIHKKRLEAFCQKQQTPLCLNCVLTGHKNHQVVSIDEKVNSQKQKLKKSKENILKSKKSVQQKMQQSSSFSEKLKLDLNEFIFEINILYKNIIAQLKQIEEMFILDATKSVEKSIRELQRIDQNLKEKANFYNQLNLIFEELNLKQGIEFLNQSNKTIFIQENCIFKDDFELPYEKLEIQKQKILNSTIRSLQDILAFHKKRTNSSVNQRSHETLFEKDAYKTKTHDKNFQLSNRKSDNSKKNQIQSPSKIQKKQVSNVQRVSKQPQILSVNLFEKYEKHVQAKNMKKRNSQILVSNTTKSPKIEYQIKQEGLAIGGNSRKSFQSKSSKSSNIKNSIMKNKSMKSPQTQKLGLQDEERIITKNNQVLNLSQDFSLSFLNDTSLITSPQRFKNQAYPMEIQSPLSINSFMESSRFTTANDRKDETILKDSRTSFIVPPLQEVVYHFGGSKNNSIICQKIISTQDNCSISSSQLCSAGFYRTKFQCVVLNSYNANKCLILGGKNLNGERSNEIFQFDFTTKNIRKSPFELNQSLSGFGVVTYDNKMYVYGGNSFSAMKNLTEYKLGKNGFQIKRLNPMNNSRDQLGFALGFDGYIYACGGINSSNIILNSCERYCIKSNKWSSIPAMKNPRRSFTLVSLPNGLYAIGGHDGKSYLNSVQMFDFQLEKWVEISPMNQARFTHTAVATHDYQNIIVFGGFQDNPLKTVQVYSLLSNSWRFLKDMQSERYLHCSISFHQ